MAGRRIDPAAWAATVRGDELLNLLFPNSRWTSSPAAQRKLRLAVCGCVRRVWPRPTDPRIRPALDAAERFADGAALCRELDAAFKSTSSVRDDTGTLTFYACHRRLDVFAAELLGARLTKPQRVKTLYVVRDLFPDPSAPPVKVPKRWRTAAVLAIARGAYDARAFDRLPVLADALEDAGCDREPLLAHLRGPGPHVRGCWAVDAVLGLA